jgi:hypothetical protein
VTAKLGNATVVDTQAFPNGVPALNGAVEYRDLGVLSRQELSAYVDEDVCIAWVRLDHSVFPVSGALRRATYLMARS